MKIKRSTLTACLTFLTIFLVKMVLSVAPVFVELDNKVVNDVIMQLEIEHDTSTETTKDIAKEKYSEEPVYHHYSYNPAQKLVAVWHQQNKYLYFQVHHPLVPTPPPNV
jgi:hypothetical protein